MVRSSLFGDGLFGFQGILKSSMIKCGHLGLSSTRKSPSFILFMQKQLTISCVPSHMLHNESECRVACHCSKAAYCVGSQC
ncbi:hypothetical protein AAZX31_13G169700 [Glycine max]